MGSHVANTGIKLAVAPALPFTVLPMFSSQCWVIGVMTVLGHSVLLGCSVVLTSSVYRVTKISTDLER